MALSLQLSILIVVCVSAVTVASLCEGKVTHFFGTVFRNRTISRDIRSS